MELKMMLVHVTRSLFWQISAVLTRRDACAVGFMLTVRFLLISRSSTPSVKSPILTAWKTSRNDGKHHPSVYVWNMQSLKCLQTVVDL
jgi:hypothetical protein